MRESSTPASESGAPTRAIVGKARQSGAVKRSSPRRSAIARPSKNPPPRTITEASAAPSTPSRGNGPTPAIRSGSRTIDTATDPASMRNGVRVSPAARKVASTAKNPNTSAPPTTHVDRYDRHGDPSGQHEKRRARVAGGPEGGFDREEPEHQRAAHDPRRQIRSTQHRDVRRYVHEAEHRGRHEIPGDADHQSGAQRIGHRRSGGTSRALGL